MAYNNVKVKARQVATQTNTQTKDLGIVANVPMGEWNASAQYKKLNTVRSHNATYQAKKDNVGVEPTVTASWQEIWQVVAYDGGQVSPDGNYPQMSVGQATNDSNGDNIAQSLQSIREDIQNESHFRGYLATNAEIQALSGTPNDYAYSAESGTVWIYQTETGWTDSGKSVPDQTVPASNSLPIMDGIASIGTSEAYARGDHKHPSDTTKANISALPTAFPITIPSARWNSNSAILTSTDNAIIGKLTSTSNLQFSALDESATNVINYNVVANSVSNGSITFTRSGTFTGNITGTIIVISF